MRLISVCTKNGIHVTIGTVVAVVDSVVRIVKFITNYERYLDKRVATRKLNQTLHYILPVVHQPLATFDKHISMKNSLKKCSSL